MNQFWGQEIFREIKMRKYIIDLTNHLIAKNGYDQMFQTFKNKDSFLKYVKDDLTYGEVADMNPATLGKIMCSFEIGDVMSAHPGKEVLFGGDCENMLREMVALCLAYVIRDRLDPIAQKLTRSRDGAPQYFPRVKS